MRKIWIVWDVEKARPLLETRRYADATQLADAREELDGRPFLVTEKVA